MRMSKILVVTATLGQRESLARTIDSVRTVGGDDVHHVIVCPETLIPALKSRYEGIECIPEPREGRGIYCALNHGFRSYGRQYPYLTFINDDDYWLPEYRRLIDVMLADDSLDMAYGRTEYVDEDGRVFSLQSCSPFFSHFVPLLKHDIVLLTQQATLIKSSLFFELGGFDESYRLVADTKFWAMLSLRPINHTYVDAVCAAYTIQDGQLSADKELQTSEHRRLKSELQLPGVSSYLKVCLFRVMNIGVYIKRKF